MDNIINSKNLPALARYFQMLYDTGVTIKCPEYEAAFKKIQSMEGEIADVSVRRIIEEEVNKALRKAYLNQYKPEWEIEHCNDNSVQLFRKTYDEVGNEYMDFIRVAPSTTEGEVVLTVIPEFPAGNEAKIQLPSKDLFEWFKQTHYALRSIDTTNG